MARQSTKQPVQPTTPGETALRQLRAMLPALRGIMSVLSTHQLHILRMNVPSEQEERYAFTLFAKDGYNVLEGRELRIYEAQSAYERAYRARAGLIHKETYGWRRYLGGLPTMHSFFSQSEIAEHAEREKWAKEQEAAHEAAMEDAKAECDRLRKALEKAQKN